MDAAFIMAMDFFESQDVARRKTGRLVLLFALGVVLIILTIHLLVAGLGQYIQSETVDRANRTEWLLLWDWRVLGIVSGATILVVGFGSLYKIAELRGGGAVVAQSLGGRLINHGTPNGAQQRVLNIVEEMAIASGTPVPPVYVMENEEAINAFAAGFSPGSAVIGVTKGTIEQLSRDELQGVIAHEFSHILNGDMRLNIRLIGVLHGILVIGLIGGLILRSMAYSSHRRSSRDSKGGLPIIVLGLGLMLIGYLGTVFGSLIKSAVSRQREFLADSSAIQFTRNPNGIGGALKKIGGFVHGSLLDNPKAPEASHMFFGQGIRIGLAGLFATHPPLAERIRRIDPSWDGTLESTAATAPARETPKRPPTTAAASGFADSAPGRKRAKRPPPRSALNEIGRPTEAHLRHAAELTTSLPAEVTEAAHEPYGARALVYAMLINTEAAARKKQLERLAKDAEPDVNKLTRKLLPIVERLETKVRLPLVDMAIPALRSLSPAQYKAFIGNVHALIHADKKIALFEWTLQRVLRQHLAEVFEKTRPPRAHYYALARLRSQCETLLSTLAYAGHVDATVAGEAFDAGADQLGVSQLTMRSMDTCGLGELGEALDVLVKTAPRVKRKLLAACAACIAHDRQVTTNEAELLRGIADALGCPVPPLLSGQALT